LSFALLSILPTIYTLCPSHRSTVRKFLTVSHPVPGTSLYTKGPDDFYLVFSWIILFTFMRAVCMDYILVPFARMRGITGAKELVRFAEQAWILIYYSFFWGLGTVGLTCN
jgi:acyl-CoA-dependent ceramide synthase